MYESGEKPSEISLGERLTIPVLRGRGESIISRMRDGRVILFNKENPYFNELKPGMMVTCKVNFIAPNYVIVDPISPPEAGVEAVRLGLKMVSEAEDWEHAMMANALLYILETLDELKRKG
jgi:hypothetical protein